MVTNNDDIRIATKRYSGNLLSPIEFFERKYQMTRLTKVVGW